MKFLTFIFLTTLFYIHIKCNDIAFINIGTINIYGDEFRMYRKTFYIPRYFKGNWIDAATICSSYDLEFASLHTLEEYNAIVPMLRRVLNFYRDSYYISGIALTPLSIDDWYWSSGTRIEYIIPWCPGEPNSHEELCMSLQWSQNYTNVCFNDANCSGMALSFICQKREMF
ncbi:hypothetical protein PVAND_005380 [Polypedilum vanderplanki]|uniref:C-type lectin domain-containing protein n=1 Tax=Polypedilum vanderplanki TaxID=319348 RepID=A0A9J6C086_POLVA|nr:hypothetical protein PVAND_005380 [Polypedilum vanderplanki]